MNINFSIGEIVKIEEEDKIIEREQIGYHMWWQYVLMRKKWAKGMDIKII